MKSFLFITMFIIFTLEMFAFPVKITSWRIIEDVKRLNEMNVSIDNVNSNTQTIIAYVHDDSEYDYIRSNGFIAERLPDLAKDYADSLWLATKDSDDPLREYYDINEYNNFMIATAAQYPSICQLFQFGTSLQGIPLYFLKISDNVELQENEPEFRYMSSIHGNEVVGYDLLIRLIQSLTSDYNTDIRITNIVNNTELWICPMLNPDGYVAHSRYNNNGVDLNRNFPLPVGSQHPDGMAWQQETMAIMNHSENNNIILSANYHGGALVVNYPWDYTYPLAPDDNLLIQASLAYSSHNQPMYNSSSFPQGITNGAQWYVANGTLQDWCYGYVGDMDLTIEVSEVMWPNSSQLDTFWSQNEESMLSLLEFVQKGVHGTVTNSEGAPLAATISISTPGIDISTDPDAGDYHRLLSSGTYTITAYADGYAISNAEVLVPLNGSVTHNFVLEPAAYADFFGVVTDLQGFPVSNAHGSFTYGDASFDFQADNSGNFSLTNIPSGDFDVVIGAQGYGAMEYTVTVTSENNRQIFILPQPLFADDFESGIGNWNLQSPWSVINQLNSHVLTDSPSGNYTNNRNINASMINPVSLNNISNPTLSFDFSYNLETNYDFFYVQVSTNGTTWTNIEEYTGDSTEMHSVRFPLDAFAGSNIYVRFKLTSDESVTEDGVYIDNVVITGMPTMQTVYGDVDSNWIANMSDIHHIMEYCVGNDPIPEIDSVPWSQFRIEAADVDNDNMITATDAYYIYMKLNQYDSPYPSQGSENYQFSNPTIQLSDLVGDAFEVNALNYNDLKALTLGFTSDLFFQIDAIDWNPNLSNILTAIGFDNTAISLLALNNAELNTALAEIHFQSDSPLINVSGLANDVQINMNIDTTSSDDDNTVPYVTSLHGCFPNPFNPETNVSFSLAEDNTPVLIKVFNLKGQIVKTLSNSKLHKGFHSIKFDGTDNKSNALGSGVYYYQLSTPGHSFTGKMVLIK